VQSPVFIFVSFESFEKFQSFDHRTFPRAVRPRQNGQGQKIKFAEIFKNPEVFETDPFYAFIFHTQISCCR
jgi:hypothetical protein